MKKNSIFLLIFLGIRLATFSQGEDDHWISLYGPPINGDKPLANCFRLPDPQCNFFSNNNFNRSAGYDPTIVQHYQNPFHNDLIPDWMAACGSPNVYDGVNFNDPPPNISTGYAGMGSWFDPVLFCEGIAQKLPVLNAGDSYGMSFFKKRKIYADPQLNNWIDNFYIVLMHCEDYSSLTPILYDPPPLPQNSQVIYCERAVRNTSWEQVIFNFIPDDDYDMAIMYVQQDPTSPPSGKLGYLLMSFPEILENSGNFSAGTSPTTGNCHVTIGPNPLNCAFANSQFTWTDPNGVIVYQGPNQTLDLDMNSAAPGNYTLTMNVPGAVVSVPTNSCSVVSPPTASATVNVPAPSCNCTGLQIINPTFDYEWDALPPMSLSTCSTNKLCNVPLNGDDIFHFAGMSNQANGNIWQIRKYNGPLYPNSNGIEINGIYIDYPASETFTTYSTNVSGDFDLFTMVGNDCNFEIKLINTITNTSQIIYVNIVMQGGIISGGNFFCVSSGTSICPIPHKLIAGYNQPGYSYQWTLPTGMIPCSSLTNAWITWDDANFDYNDPNHPPLVASLAVTNIFGCPSTGLNINIDPSVCNMMRQNNSIVEKKAVKDVDSPLAKSENTATVFPNPARSTININSDGSFNKAIILNSQGKLMKEFSIYAKTQLVDISSLANGVYLVVLKKKDGSSEAIRIVKH